MFVFGMEMLGFSMGMITVKWAITNELIEFRDFACINKKYIHRLGICECVNYEQNA